MTTATLPKQGWTWRNGMDLRLHYGENYHPAACQFCGRRDLRFVHAVNHPDHPADFIIVGRICAAKLTLMNVDLEEQGMQNRFNRWETFKNNWNVNQKGNHVRRYRGLRLTVFPDRYVTDRFRFSISSISRRDSKPSYSPNWFATPDEAIRKLFDEVDSLQMQQC